MICANLLIKMTSTTTIGREQRHLEGRTVRDIVEYSPDQVTEVWCRKIFRQILQSLELQYAMHMPHRAITPDTVVFHDNGEPLLVPSDVPAPRYPHGDATEDALRDDLTALAGLVHYAITRELTPTGPLAGRAPEGYSESLVTAVDLCLAPDPARRPRTIEALRDILGIVALGPALPAQREPGERAAPESPAAAPAVSPFAAGGADPDATLSFLLHPERKRFGMELGRWQRWALAAGGAAMLLALAVTVYGELRDSGSYDQIALKLPQQPESGMADRPAPPPAAPAGVPAATSSPEAATAMQPGAPPPAPAQAPPVPSARSQAFAESAMGASGTSGSAGASGWSELPAATSAAAPVAAGGIAYRVQIQPWGTIYVDGVDRGVSPPVKRLVLAPGRHTVRIANPNFQDRVLEVDSAGGGNRIAVDFGSESP
jgi:hypothetical protein